MPQPRVIAKFIQHLSRRRADTEPSSARRDSNKPELARLALSGVGERFPPKARSWRLRLQEIAARVGKR